MIELFSDEFPKHIDKSKLTAKTKASEMEHAIRRHIKINEDKDPGQAAKFKKRLEEIMRKFQDNWELCVENLQDFIEKMKDKEDGSDSVDGLPPHVSSFYRLIQLIAFDGKEISEDLHIQVKNLTEEIMDELNKKLDITNFWKKASLVRELTGEIEDLFYMSKIETIYEKHEQLAANVIKLAKDTENIIKRNRK
jgi:type I restriction enzyme R subunit